MSTFADPAPVVEVQPALDPIALVLSDALRELIWTGASSSPRSRQREAGMSEIGGDCDRALAYKIAQVDPVNVDTDLMPSIIGTGFHLNMEKIFSALDPRRWLVVTPVAYKGIPGTCDLYDRRRRLVIDWKSTSKAKLRKLRAEGPPRRQQVQVQLYGAAMRERGEDVARVALAYVARDGSLDDLWVWSTPFDQQLVDGAIERYLAIAKALETKQPGSIAPTPGLLCRYCDHFQPGATDTNRACPGNSNSR